MHANNEKNIEFLAPKKIRVKNSDPDFLPKNKSPVKNMSKNKNSDKKAWAQRDKITKTKIPCTNSRTGMSGAPFACS
jgi:hypothetical protein